jgi:Orsellinic acid/F9775 biosynthesis cluster protein D
MLPIRLGPHDLLEYDARHGVLICRECQYAIQKSALESHLLKHKIYRDERQRLLSSIAQLELFEPDDVPLPTPDFPPIDALPIICGYRCTTVGCGNLCASSKRMRRHRSEIHGLSDPRNFSSFTRPVKLQTFFRGTKLRYFEVTPLSWAGATGVAPLTTTKDDYDNYENENEKYDEEKLGEQMHDAGMPLLPPRVRTAPKTPPKCSLVDLNLETLTYFHHFTTTTSLTLPSAESPQLATHYWQTDVVVQALGRRWLMCGLLAISACHLAVLANDATIERVHREQSAQFFLEFSNGWEEAANRDLSMEVEEEVKKAGGQMVCILRCAQWASAEYMLDQGIIPEPAAPSQLQSIMTTIRGFGIWSDDNDGQEQTFAQASRILNTRSTSNAGSFGAFPSYDNTLSTLLNHLGTLPSRMAEALGKPENTQDVLATLSAIAALVECCVTSFASDEAGRAWRAMATWLIKVPGHFNHMVSHHSRAALVVLAHWAVLVQRAEHCGCWFLRGSVRKILLRIAEQLPADDFDLESCWKLNSMNKII